MADRAALDSKGRIVIPKELREGLHLKRAMRKKRGIWVFRSGERGSVEDVNKAVRDIREARERSLFGPKRRDVPR